MSVKAYKIVSSDYNGGAYVSSGILIKKNSSICLITAAHVIFEEEKFLRPKSISSIVACDSDGQDLFPVKIKPGLVIMRHNTASEFTDLVGIPLQFLPTKPILTSISGQPLNSLYIGREVEIQGFPKGLYQTHKTTITKIDQSVEIEIKSPFDRGASGGGCYLADSDELIGIYRGKDIVNGSGILIRREVVSEMIQHYKSIL